MKIKGKTLLNKYINTICNLYPYVPIIQSNFLEYILHKRRNSLCIKLFT